MWIFDPNCNGQNGARSRATPNAAADVASTGRALRVRSSAITGQAMVNHLLRLQNTRRPRDTSVNGGGNGGNGMRCVPLSLLEMIRVVEMVDSGSFSMDNWGQGAAWWGASADTSPWIKVTL